MSTTEEKGRGQPHFLSKRRDWLLRTRATCTCTRITQLVTSSVLKPPPRALSFPQHCQTYQRQCNISISQRKSAHNNSEGNFLLNCVASLWRTMQCPMSPGLSSPPLSPVEASLLRPRQVSASAQAFLTHSFLFSLNVVFLLCFP